MHRENSVTAVVFSLIFSTIIYRIMVTPTEDIRLLLLYLSGITLFRDLRSFHKLNSKLLLLGSGFFDRNQNAQIFLSVKSYIKKTERFDFLGEMGKWFVYFPYSLSYRHILFISNQQTLIYFIISLLFSNLKQLSFALKLQTNVFSISISHVKHFIFMRESYTLIINANNYYCNGCFLIYEKYIYSINAVFTVFILCRVLNVFFSNFSLIFKNSCKKTLFVTPLFLHSLSQD